MRKHGFLSKISEEGKLKVVEPSRDITDAYLKKSESYHSSAKILLDNDKTEEAVSMTYYSMYYTALALLFKTGIKSENHSATIIILKDVFGLDNSDIMKAKKERVDKQYYIDFQTTREDAERLLKTAEEFNARVYDFMEKLTNQEIAEYRQKIGKMI
jgi:uncharacterized protein (UPF0332 family)